MKRNGSATGSVMTNTQRKTARAPSHSCLPSVGYAGGGGNCTSFWRIGSYSAGPSVSAISGGSTDAMAVCPSSVAAAAMQAPQRADGVPLFAEATHEVEDAVDDAPGDVASQGTDEHRAHIVATGLGDAEGAGEREHHDEAEERLSNALVRLEHPPLHGTLGGRR